MARTRPRPFRDRWNSVNEGSSDRIEASDKAQGGSVEPAENMMANSCLLGVDVGSYESKGTLTDLDGRVLASTRRSHQLEFPSPGHVEQDVDTVWWGEFADICRELTDVADIRATAIAGVAASGVFALLPVDARGRALRPKAIMYGIDTRAEHEIGEIRLRLGEATILSRTGNSLTSQSMGPKILWLKKHEPEVYDRARGYVSASGYIVGRLTGRVTLDHFQAAFYGPMYDLSRQAWASDLCEGIVSIEDLPELRWANEIAGHVTAEAAAATGLREGTPVVVGTCDVGVEALSVGVTKPGEMMLMYGSTAWITLIVDQPLRDSRLWASPFIFPGQFCLHGGMATSGTATRFFRDLVGQDLLAVERGGGAEAYTVLMDSAARTPEGADGLIFLPYLAGERTPINDPGAKGMVFGMKMIHGRGHFFRAAFEGVGYSIAHAFEAMQDAGATPEKAVAVGGGVKNRQWLQAVSDIAEIRQEIPDVTLGASYGDAFLAGLATGLIQNPQRIRDWIRIRDSIHPRPEHSTVYKRQFDIYKQLYHRTRDLMRRIDG